MIAKYCKMALALSMLLMILSGCGQQAIKKVEILTNDQGLPEAEELLEKSSELINSLESYSVSSKVDLQNYGETKEKLIWDGVVSTTDIKYIKSPYLLFSETHYKENDTTRKSFITDAYGILENSGKQWEVVSDYYQELLPSQKEQWKLAVDPYADLKNLDGLTMIIGQDEDSYILDVAGNIHNQTSQEGLYDSSGEEYTLVITTDMQYKNRYVVHKDTLLPKQKIQEIDQAADYSPGKKTYSHRTITYTYGDYNNINTKKLIDEAKEIAKSVNEEN
jgi:hypothetical protein